MRLFEVHRKHGGENCRKKQATKVVLLLWVALCAALPGVTGAQGIVNETTALVEDGSKLEKRILHRKAVESLPEMYLRQPVWRSEIVYRESSVLIESKEGEALQARLAFPAKEVLLVKNAAGTVSFVAQEDWKLSDDGMNLVFQDRKKIASIKESEFFKPKDSTQSYRHRTGKPEESLLYAPGSWFHDRNVEITYRRKIVKPLERPLVYGKLPRTQKLLLDKTPFVIGISGDSISTGLDASSTANVVPFQLGYAELMAAQLEMDFGTSLQVENRSVAGWSVANGVNDLGTLLKANPSLLVVAYGMNDVGRRDPNWFRGQLNEMIKKVQVEAPQCDILLVSPMLGNPEWVHTPPEMFDSYRDVMKECVSDGIAFADVTEVWKIMCHHKHFLDLTGNGLNHPNDFGHRLYAMVLLEMFPK